MTENMGTFRIDIELENHARPGERRALSGVLVDTGALAHRLRRRLVTFPE